jgi:hypothetical protein
MSLVLNYRWGDLESRSENGHMALHIAAIGSNLWMVRKLVEAGGIFLQWMAMELHR